GLFRWKVTERSTAEADALMRMRPGSLIFGWAMKMILREPGTSLQKWANVYFINWHVGMIHRTQAEQQSAGLRMNNTDVGKTTCITRSCCKGLGKGKKENDECLSW
ncbi:hypothetical protein Tco_1208857, partial [Tanacetum coccineum]